MLPRLHSLAIPTAVSIAFFDATYFAIARLCSFSGRDVALGVAAGAAGGLCVFGAALWENGGPVALVPQRQTLKVDAKPIKPNRE